MPPTCGFGPLTTSLTCRTGWWHGVFVHSAYLVGGLRLRSTLGSPEVEVCGGARRPELGRTRAPLAAAHLHKKDKGECQDEGDREAANGASNFEHTTGPRR